MLPLLAPFLPICSRNLPSFENFRTVLPPLPASHTLSLPSIGDAVHRRRPLVTRARCRPSG